jgi:formylglycine-generating enzyme required for sulfatase activity
MIIRTNFTRRKLLRGAGLLCASPLLNAMQAPLPSGLNAVLDGSGMVRIPSGEFMMGSSSGVADEQPVHPVRITHGFEMGKYEVTQGLWEAVMHDPHAKPAIEKPGKTNPPSSVNPSYFKGPDLPVESVSWDDVQPFLARLNARDEKHEYRLPTEAEWEYACRAGKSGDQAAALDAIAWHKANSMEQTQPVGKKEPNAWGLYDMLGNVAEWTADWYSFDYYANSPVADPTGPESGSYRVFRGGAWLDTPKFCRASSRAFDFPINGQSNVGFRVVRTAK